MSCSFQHDATLDEFTLGMLAPLGPDRYPLSGSMELTERCNLECVHCYINQPAALKPALLNELSTSGWMDIIDQMSAAGTLFLLMTGGEPLLRQDFSEIFTHARKKGLLVTLFSNVTLLTPELADLLAGWSLHSLEVSLYGATRETYEQVTRQPGSFERCLRGIELALSRGIKTNLKTVLLTSNRHELDAMQALTESLGLDFRYDSTLWPRLDGSTQNLRYQVGVKETLALDLTDPERRAAWEKTAQENEGRLIREKYAFTCGAAFRSFHISASGRMTPCMMVRRPAISIPEMGFSQAWKQIGQIRGITREKHTACETCTAGTFCTQCPGWSLALSGDYETINPEICEQGRLRQAHFQKAIYTVDWRE